MSVPHTGDSYCFGGGQWRKSLTIGGRSAIATAVSNRPASTPPAITRQRPVWITHSSTATQNR